VREKDHILLITMRNAPSFLGDFTKQKSKRSPLTPAELPIEKEANLREKKKKILQRLKKNVDPDDVMAAQAPSQPLLIGEVPDKVIFSPRTSKRFTQASQRLVESSSGDEIKRLDRGRTPVIVLQKATEEEEAIEDTTGLHGHANRRNLKLRTELRNEDDSAAPVYVPSFSDKPLRHLPESPSRTRNKDKASECTIPTRKSYKYDASSSKIAIRNETSSNVKTRQSRAEVPVIITEKDNSSLESSVSDDDSDFEYVSSPFRRSASFHSLKDKHQAAERRNIRTSAGRSRQFLKVDDYNLGKASSLSSLYDSSSTMLDGREEELSLSTTSFAKLNQQKLEEDFQRVEEDLDRAFTELRKYLRTS
jgi:hypothetical protein